MNSVAFPKSPFFVLLVLFALCSAARAQQTEISSRIPGQPLTTEFLPFADHLTMAFIHENAAEIMVLDRDFQIITERAVFDLGLSEGASYLGMSEEQSTWHLYFLNRGSLIGVQVPRAGQASLVRLEGYGNTTFSGSFTFNGTMHLLRMSAWDNELRLVKFRDGQRVFSESFPIQTEDFVSRANGDFQRIESGAIRMEDSYFPAKWYRFGDRLVFTLDESGHTDVVEVDLLSSTVSEQRFRWDSTRRATGGNSLCLGSYLIHIQAGADQFFLDMYEMNPLKANLGIRVGREESIEVRDLREGWQVSDPLVRIWDPENIQSTREEWLQVLSAHESLAIGFYATEHGYSIEAGGLSATEEVGASGLIVDRNFHKASMHLDLKIPTETESMAAPVVFSSLRYPSLVMQYWWNNQPVYVQRGPEGLIRIWD